MIIQKRNTTMVHLQNKTSLLLLGVVLGVTLGVAGFLIPDSVLVSRDYRTCETKTYLISKESQLWNMVDELECVFWAGIAPSKPPVGNYRASAVTTKHSTLFAQLLNPLWQGHVFTQTMCDQELKYFDQPTVAIGIKPSTALASVKVWDAPLAEGEHNDNADSLVLDWSKDYKVECPIEDTRPIVQNAALLFAPYVPVNPPGSGMFMDSVRIVGKDPDDDGVIFLEKYYTNSLTGYVTIGYVTFKVYDPDIVQETPDALQVSLLSPFTYKYIGPNALTKSMITMMPGEIISLPWGSFMDAIF